MRAKTVAIFLFTFAIFVGLLVWRVDSLFFGDKLNWSEAGSRSQMSVIISSLEGQIQNLKDLFFVSYPKLVTDGRDFSSTEPYSSFQAMMTVTPTPMGENFTDWKLSGMIFQQRSPTRAWAPSYISLALKTVKASDIRPGSVGIYSLLDPERKPYLLMLMHGNDSQGSVWSAGLLGPEVFQKLMDRQKGQLSQVYLVNMQAQTLGHTVPEYVGSLLSEDPLVAKMIHSGSASGSGFFRNLKGQEIQGLYEQVGSTNVFAVISTPMQELLKNREGIRWQLILLGFGVALIGGALFVFMDSSSEGKPAGGAPGHAPKGPQSVSTANIPSPRLADGVADRSSVAASAKIAASISHELKGPLTSILGHVQLAKAHTADAKAQEHLVRLENDARQAREMIQKLLIFSGEDKYKTEKASLSVAVQKALKSVEGRALSKGVKISKDLQNVPDFVFSPELVSRGVENILLNAIEAMERVSKKELLIKLTQKDSAISLKVIDSGEGIEASQIEKIFEPFFTTRATLGHVGLGLSTALGIFKESHGEVTIQSERGKGTSVEVVFTPSLTATATAPTDVAKVTPPVASKPATPASKVDTEITQTSSKIPMPGAPVSQLLVDTSVEKMIDEDPLADKKLDEQKASMLPPVPPDEFEKTVLIEAEPPPAKPNVPPPIAGPAVTAKPSEFLIDVPGMSPPRPSAKPQQIAVPEVEDMSASETAVTVVSENASEPFAAPAAPATTPTPEVAVQAKPEPKAEPGLDEKQFSSKIDKPKIELKKKNTKPEDANIHVRRPGERL